MELKYNEAPYKLTPSTKHSSKLIHFSAPVEILCILGVNVKLLPKLVLAKCCAVFTSLAPSHVGGGKSGLVSIVSSCATNSGNLQ